MGDVGRSIYIRPNLALGLQDGFNNPAPVWPGFEITKSPTTSESLSFQASDGQARFNSSALWAKEQEELAEFHASNCEVSIVVETISFSGPLRIFHHALLNDNENQPYMQKPPKC
ncbi:hypothetical protein BTUL_0202g00110 [Botrytis tulipae]|uniref:Uncharacterized protein n=1 Tax=Botrytis tulipae TaxID=87230 RepID=A0A4Z1ECX2_9HELO|nr:hypothetical protein BTUL_0202g00110 [Botrytis tulipae]